jgi:hypothetical protein
MQIVTGLEPALGSYQDDRQRSGEALFIHLSLRHQARKCLASVGVDPVG